MAYLLSGDEDPPGDDLSDDCSDETTRFCHTDKMELKAVTETDHLVIRRQLYTQDSLDQTYSKAQQQRTLCDAIKATCRVSPQCVGRRALNFLPIVRFLRSYQWRQWVLPDIISGLSAGFIHLPQGLGFGILASLAPVYGLYTTFFPILTYLLFGTSPHVSMGTNAVIALLTANLVEREADHFRTTVGVNVTLSEEVVLQYKVGVATAACFVGGLILLAMGLLRVGFITNFLAKSFIAGFTFAAAVHIASSQVVKMLHMKLPGRSGMGKLILTYIDIFKNITDANPADVIVGLICMAILLAVKIGVNERYKHKLKVPIPIELIVVIVSTIITYFTRLDERFNLAIVGDVPTGMPAPTLPPFDMLPRVASDAFVTAILIFAINISMAKLTAKLHDIKIDDNQELVAYGLCQLVGSVFQNFPSCTAPPRTMILNSLGTKSTLNGLLSAAFILLVLLVLGQLFVSLPIAMLAAMIIVAMKDLLMNIRNLKSLWHVNKADFFIWLLTAVVSVFGDLDIGLLAGVVFSMVTVLVVSQLAKGRVLGKADTEDIIMDLNRKGINAIPGVRIFRFESALYFASQERFKSQLFSLVMNPSSCPRREMLTKVISEMSVSSDSLNGHGNSTAADATPVADSGGQEASLVRHLILDCSAMTYIDVSGLDMLQLIVSKFEGAGVEVLLTDVPSGTMATLDRAGFLQKLGKDKIFYTAFDALKRLYRANNIVVRL